MPAEGRDPCGYITTPPSVVVKVSGTARDDINGLLGIAVSYNMDRERYLVHMTKSQSTMAFKKENLIRAGMMESYLAQWQQLQNDPRVRQKMAHYLQLCRQWVAPLKLSHVIVGVLILVACLMYLVGFTKTLMTLSLLALVAVIAGPDILAKQPPKVILENFPNRTRMALEQQLPMLRGKISNRMAMGVMVLLVALCLQSLFLTGGKRRHSGSTSHPHGQQHHHHHHGRYYQQSRPNMPLMDQETLEKVYALGYEDAKEDRPHGTSLKVEDLLPPPLHGPHLPGMDERGDEMSFPTLIGDYDDENGSSFTGSNNNSNNSNSWYSKLGSVTNAMSLFYLYRNIMDLGKDPLTGLFSTAQLFANLHRLEMIRKALLALSFYNVLRIFF